MRKLTIVVAILAFLGTGVAFAQHRKPDDPTPQRQPPQQAQPKDEDKAKPRPPERSRPEPRRPGQVVIVPEPGWPWWGYPSPYPPHGGFRVFADWETGNVRLDVSPEDAQVYVDRYYAGIVDDFDGIFQRLTLRAGPHLIEMRKTGYTSLAFELNLYPGQTVTYRRTMEPSSGENTGPPAVASAPGFEEGALLPPVPDVAGPPGEVRFDVTPKDAEIYADGFYAGLVDDFGGSQRLQLAPGRHHVVLKLEGYDTIEVDLSIDSGRSITYRATLRQIAAR